MSLPFSQPGGQGDKFEPGDYNGNLLMLYPKSYNPAEETKFGTSPSADVDVIVVDRADPATGKPVFLQDAKVFGNLARSVRNDVGGGVVLGRLGQGVNTKGNPPWILNPYSDADAQAAAGPHAEYQAGKFKPSSPAGPGNAPTPADPWAAVPGAAAAPAPSTGGWGAPPAAPAAPAGPAIDPQLVSFLQARGVQVTPDMTQATAEMIAKSLPQ